MAQAEHKMPLAKAKQLADALVARVTPYCNQTYIAGSIRREKELVSDIEVVVVPRIETKPDPTDLFGERTIQENVLYREWASKAEDKDTLQWIKTGTPDIERLPDGVDPTGRYWKAHLPKQKCNLDIFLATPERLGTILLIRTGSSEFSEAVVTYAKRVYHEFKGGLLWRYRGKDSEPEHVPTPTEVDIFRALNLQWVDPRLRQDASQIVAGWDENAYGHETLFAMHPEI